MKKLMIAAAIVCAAAMSQAATCNWYITSDGNNAYAGYLASSVGGTYTAGNAVGATAYVVYFEDGNYGISQNDLLTGLRNGKTMEDFSSYLVSPDTGVIGSDGTLAKTKITNADKDMLDEYDSISSYIVLVQDNNVFLTAEDYYTYDGLDETGSVIYLDDFGTKYLRDNDGTRAYSDAGWYSTVPEPTSGLLLLIGVGALALRRRRA